MEENYIITFEDGGQHYQTDKIEEHDIDGLKDGLLAIIRTSDLKELDTDGETWNDLPKWGER